MFNLLLSGLIGFIIGTLTGSKKVRYWLYGKLIRKLLFRKRLITVKPYLATVFLCDDGVVAVNGVIVTNNIPFVDIEECHIQAGPFGAVHVPWRDRYQKPLSDHSPGTNKNIYDGKIEDLLSSYATRIHKYIQEPKAKISIPTGVSRKAEILVEIRRDQISENNTLSEIFSKGHGECRLVYSETFEGEANFNPVSLDPGWTGKLAILSERFGLIESFDIKIPENPEKYVRWSGRSEVPEEFVGEENQGYLLKLDID